MAGGDGLAQSDPARLTPYAVPLVRKTERAERKETRAVRTVLLAVVYYLVVTPIGLLSRVVRDPLARGWHRKAESYWSAPTPPLA